MKRKTEPKSFEEIIGATWRKMKKEWDKPEFQVALTRAQAKHDEQKRAEAEAELDMRGVPADPKVRAVALSDKPHETPALFWVQEGNRWRQTHRGSPLVQVLSGPAGTGKTAGCCWLVRRTYGACCVYASRVTSTPENAWPDNQNLWKRWRTAPLLLIAELGDERGDAGVISSLIGERYNDARATLCTTNLSRADFERRYLTERLRSRLQNAQAQGLEGLGTLVARGCPWWIDTGTDDLRDPQVALRVLGATR